MGDVVLADFHATNASWLGAWDFVFSNTVDHSYDPGKALMAWRRSLRQEKSLLVLHTSEMHGKTFVDEVDVFGASLNEYCALLQIAGFKILDVFRVDGKNGYYDELIFAARGENPHMSDEVPNFPVEKLVCSQGSCNLRNPSAKIEVTTY